MKPLSQLPADEARALRGVLFDLDDTLLDKGVLTLGAYTALWRLAQSGLRLVVVTGRPWSWVDVIARQWPIDAAIAENGAVGVWREGAGALRRWDRTDETTRQSRRAQLASAHRDLSARFADLRVSDDSQGRISDLAFDIGESQRVPPSVVEAMAAAAAELGLFTFLSSVHLHITLDEVDKASGTLALLSDVFGHRASDAELAYAYVGDSGNDAACFARFRTTFGVRNVEPFLPGLPCPPRYLASRERGEGFAEITERILELRRP